MTIEELQILITANTSELRKEIVKTQSSLTNLEQKAGLLEDLDFLKELLLHLVLGS